MNKLYRYSLVCIALCAVAVGARAMDAQLELSSQAQDSRPQSPQEKFFIQEYGRDGSKLFEVITHVQNDSADIDQTSESVAQEGDLKIRADQYGQLLGHTTSKIAEREKSINTMQAPAARVYAHSLVDTYLYSRRRSLQEVMRQQLQSPRQEPKESKSNVSPTVSSSSSSTTILKPSNPAQFAPTLRAIADTYLHAGTKDKEIAVTEYVNTCATVFAGVAECGEVPQTIKHEFRDAIVNGYTTVCRSDVTRKTEYQAVVRSNLRFLFKQNMVTAEEANGLFKQIVCIERGTPTSKGK